MKFAFRPFVAASMILAFSGPAEAAQGKKVSTGEALGSGPVAVYPLITSALTVPVPKAYKSKANVLKVTTTYQAGCNSGDSLGSRISIDGQTPHDSVYPYEAYDEDAPTNMVTKVYVIDPESAGGPAIAPDSSVILQFSSASGTGCTASYIRMVVEALK